jgi:D-galactarolactone cycloisomerase
MKIRNVTTFALRAKLERPFRFSQGSYATRATVLVRIETAGGAVGWGEAYGPAEVAKAAIDSFFAPLVVGRDAREREFLWHLMYASSVDYGQKGIMLAAISAIDIALWDLCAREVNLPLYRYLGGAEQTSVPCYATGFYFCSEDIGTLTSDFAREAERYRSQGFIAMKLKVGLGVRSDLRLIEAVRQAAGDSTCVMIDANHAYDPTTAIDLGRRAERFDLSWFEEPVSPLDVAGYAAVRRALKIPIAGGECEYTRFGFDSLFRAGAVDYAQPDLCACGGITEALKIATLASLHSVHVTPHVWGTAIGQSAALHFYAARQGNPATLIAETKWIECDQSENPLRNSIVRDPICLRDGEWLLPQTPGLGVDVLEDKIAMFNR